MTGLPVLWCSLHADDPGDAGEDQRRFEVSYPGYRRVRAAVAVTDEGGLVNVAPIQFARVPAGWTIRLRYVALGTRPRGPGRVYYRAELRHGGEVAPDTDLTLPPGGLS